MRQTLVANEVLVGVGSFNPTVSSAGAVGAWTHYVIVVNGTNVTLWRNNVMIASSSGVTLSYPNKFLRIGANGDSLAEYLDGRMDELRVYNRALTSTERSTLYSNGSVLGGLLLYIPFGECDSSSYNLTYDSNGNLQQDSEHYYEYNNFNQLLRVRNGSVSGAIVSDYVYGDSGQRLKKTEYWSNGTVKSRTYYIGENFVRENTSGTVNDSVFYLAHGQIVAENRSGTMLFMHANHRGDAALTTNSAGAIVEETSLEPYGAALSGGSDRFVFTGQERDTEIGLDYFDARYYSPDLSIFVASDPIRGDVYNPQRISTYAYVLNNPLNKIDPDGKDAIPIVRDIVDPQIVLPGGFGVDVPYNPGHASIVVGNQNDGYIGYSYTADTDYAPRLNEDVPGTVIEGEWSRTWNGAINNLEDAEGITDDSLRYNIMQHYTTSPQQDAAMHSYAHGMGRSSSVYNACSSNCGDFVVNTMRAGGLNAKSVNIPKRVISNGHVTTTKKTSTGYVQVKSKVRDDRRAASYAAKYKK